MSWFIWVLILQMSLVVAVPVSQLRASLRKGSRLLLWWVGVCAWFDWSNLMADVIIVSAELYVSLMLESSTWSVEISWDGADGCWLRDQSNCCILLNCLLNVFQLCSRLPREICAVMIHECLVGYACSMGWKMTDSPSSVWDEFVDGVSRMIMLEGRDVMVNGCA